MHALTKFAPLASRSGAGPIALFRRNSSEDFGSQAIVIAYRRRETLEVSEAEAVAVGQPLEV